MFAFFNWTRALLTALALTLPIAPVFATRGQPSAATHTSERGQREAVEERPPAGSPELGILMIIGVVAFVILMAWIFSRVSGEGEPKGPDGSII